MESNLVMSKRFSFLLALIVIWTATSGAVMEFASGHWFIGGLLLALAIGAFGLLVSGRHMRQRAYPRSAIILLALVAVCGLMILGLNLVAFPGILGFYIYLAGYLLLMLLGAAEVWKAARTQVDAQ